MTVSKFRLSIEWKILIAPLIVIVFLVFVAIVSWYSLLRQEKALDHVVNIADKKTAVSSEIIRVISSSSGAMYRAIALCDSGIENEKIQAVTDDVKKSIHTGKKLLTSLEKSFLLSKTEIEYLKKIKQTISKFEEAATAILDMAVIDRMLAIPMMDEGDLTYTALERAAILFNNYEKKLAEKTYEKSARLAAKSRRIFIALVLFAVVSSILITVFVGKTITKPLKKILKGLTTGAEDVTSVSSMISGSSTKLASGVEKQEISIESTSNSISEISSMTSATESYASNVEKMIREGLNIIESANHSMKEVKKSMVEISKVSEESGTIVKSINEIAFQTNLLALNAAVEAARAGKAGAGFAVVADEVRNLAMKSANSADNTASLIEQTVDKINKGVKIVEKADDNFNQVARNSTSVAQIIKSINEATKEQASGIAKVTTAVHEMESIISSNGENAKDSAVAADLMNTQANKMRSFVQELVGLLGNEKKEKKVLPPSVGF